MAIDEAPRLEAQSNESKNLGGNESEHGNIDSDSLKGKDVLGLQDLDPVLNMKIHLVNNAIEELGWTPYHTKMFFLTGFGYAVDSMITLLQSVIAQQAFREFGQVGYEKGLTIATYLGMLVGALFWGFGADIIGRRHAFNLSLLICSLSAIIAGGMPNWPALGTFIALIGFGGGGNLVLDTTVLLEFLPGHKQWVVTVLAAWWGFGQTFTGAVAWGFLVPERWNCQSVDTCTRENNMGWRYAMFTSGAAVFLMSVLRVTVVRLNETPKYLLSTGEDRKVVDVFQRLAAKYNRSCSLTLEKLEECGVSAPAPNHGRFSPAPILVHLRGLFSTPKMAVSTLMIWFSWTMVGLAYPLFYVFLPTYLASRGAVLQVSAYDSWRNYTLTTISSIFGPFLAGWMCNQPLLGRKYTMFIGALMTAAFFFAYSAVHTVDQNVGFSCAIAFCFNVYYATLFAYTPEVLPSAHRATGNGVGIACNRVMGIMSAVIATVVDTSTPAPIYICGALLAALGLVAGVFPFEPYGRRSS